MYGQVGRIKAIPTRYAGVQFRSRLEARWAAFFDLVGWKWEYEPVDFDGWIPDFVIHPQRKKASKRKPEAVRKVKPILVEVKPIFELDYSLAAEIEKKLGLDITPPERVRDLTTWEDFDDWGHPLDIVEEYDLFDAWDSCPYELLICGAVLPSHDMIEVGLGVGWLFDYGDWDVAPVFIVEPGVADFCHSVQSFHWRVSGEYHGGHIPASYGIQELWREAGNHVQWRAPV